MCVENKLTVCKSWDKKFMRLEVLGKNGAGFEEIEEQVKTGMSFERKV